MLKFVDLLHYQVTTVLTASKCGYSACSDIAECLVWLCLLQNKQSSCHWSLVQFSVHYSSALSNLLLLTSMPVIG